MRGCLRRPRPINHGRVSAGRDCLTGPGVSPLGARRSTVAIVTPSVNDCSLHEAAIDCALGGRNRARSRAPRRRLATWPAAFESPQDRIGRGKALATTHARGMGVNTAYARGELTAGPGRLECRVFLKLEAQP
jgi:hypothetical protein